MEFEIKVLNKISVGALKEFVGCHVAFGGRGIVDGLLNVYKSCCYRLIEVNDNELILKGYRHRKLSCLDKIMWNQSCQVLTKQEFSNLSTYGYEK